MLDNALDDIFDGLEDDRESELKGEKAKKEFEPFSPALLADIYVSKNFYENNCISVILVRPHAVGNYYTYDIEIKSKKAIEELKEKIKKNKEENIEDDEAQRQLTRANIDIKNINSHLYDLPGTERSESTAKALNYLQTALKEARLEVDVTFNSQQKGNFKNYFFHDIKSLNRTDNPVSPKVIDMIKEDIEKRKKAQILKRKIEKPDQYTVEVVDQKPTEEGDIPF